MAATLGAAWLAEKIVDDLLDVARDDIYDATHGNYDAETIRIRLRERWVFRIVKLLGELERLGHV